MNSKQRKQVQKTFIESLLRDSSVSLACEVAGIVRATAYNWRNEDKEFATEWDDAVERARDVARQSIYSRGIIGWEEPVTSMGKIVYEYEPVLDKDGEPLLDEDGKPLICKTKLMIRKWSDPLAALYAKSNLPEYKEKQQVEHTGKDGGPIEVVNTTKEALRQKLDAIKAKMQVKADGEPS